MRQSPKKPSARDLYIRELEAELARLRKLLAKAQKLEAERTALELRALLTIYICAV